MMNFRKYNYSFRFNAFGILVFGKVGMALLNWPNDEWLRIGWFLDVFQELKF